MEQSSGILVILSGPSGAGKTTIVRMLLEKGDANLELSISATTRPPRHGEKDGTDYHFLSNEEFQSRIGNDDFLEYVEVFRTGYWYGTLRSEVESRVKQGTSVLLEIDVEGARKVVDQFPDATTIFLQPESLKELERRLRDRGTESEEAIQKRLDTANKEIADSNWYQHHVINRIGEAEQTVKQLADIIHLMKEKQC